MTENAREAEIFVLPMSFAQQRLWLLDQLTEGSAYTISRAVRLTGPLDVAALESSVDQLVKRHEALRTTFSNLEGDPVQLIAESWSSSMSVVDFRGSSPVDREAEALRLAAEEVRRPFDLAKGPLFRTSLLRLSERDHLLVDSSKDITESLDRVAAQISSGDTGGGWPGSNKR